MKSLTRHFSLLFILIFKGWIREEIPRSSGGISGARKSDVYYISPSGKRIRSKPELLKILGEHYDLATFDYYTGKMNPALASTNGKSSGSKGSKSNGTKTPYDFTRSLRNDASLVPPIRQTASIFKQPVTVSVEIYTIILEKFVIPTYPIRFTKLQMLKPKSKLTKIPLQKDQGNFIGKRD